MADTVTAKRLGEIMSNNRAKGIKPKISVHRFAQTMHRLPRLKRNLIRDAAHLAQLARLG